jgi:hypothetical protein
MSWRKDKHIAGGERFKGGRSLLVEGLQSGAEIGARLGGISYSGLLESCQRNFEFGRFINVFLVHTGPNRYHPEHCLDFAFRAESCANPVEGIADITLFRDEDGPTRSLGDVPEITSRYENPFRPPLYPGLRSRSADSLAQSLGGDQ